MHVTLGVTAHVDAGKTTLCEQLLRRAGVIRRSGRVDHGDTFMDLNALERARGITIFCEQASFDLTKDDKENVHVTLMDTPGHVDFSGEMERALSVLDCCLLVVSCAEGVQSHTVTLFKMLKSRKIPTMIFLNKTDREGADVSRVMAQMQRLLSGDCILMEQDADILREEIAGRDEALLDAHFEGEASRSDYLAGAQRAFMSGQLYPVLSGSALNDLGIDALEKMIAALCVTDYEKRTAEPFSAKVYRVRRADGTRVCYAKVLSGELSAREEIETVNGNEKVTALFGAQGAKLTVAQKVSAGQTAAIAGLSARPGETIGAGCAKQAQEIVPLMSVQVKPEPPVTAQNLLLMLRELEEEDPLLSVRAQGERLYVGIMGAVQIEVLQSVLETRFGVKAQFMQPEVIYRETIARPVIGIGHYEPLRHYAETWLRISPGAPGSGVRFERDLPPNSLDMNWQRLIRQHCMERKHPGVLTGNPVTDILIELIAGRAHLKHTEGGDFREATYRAIRHGLMQAENVLLEPYVRFELAMPQEALAKVTGELIRMGAELDAPEFEEDEASLSGTCTAAAFWDYPTKFAAATRGHGRLASRFDRYAPCKNQSQIVEEIGYNPLADERNPVGSVFCSHGAGYYVPWDEVRAHAHCEVEGV